MKKNWLVISLFLLISFSLAAEAEINFIVNVDSIFELALDRQTIEIPSVMPGQVVDSIPDNEGVKVTVKTNNGEPWYLKIHNLNELSDGKNVIPNQNFYWYGQPGKNNQGVWYGRNITAFTLDPVLAYSAGYNEFNTLPNGLDLFFKFRINVPQKQNRGTYRTVVAFTLTE